MFQAVLSGNDRTIGKYKILFHVTLNGKKQTNQSNIIILYTEKHSILHSRTKLY